jgi:hypothetical protein
MMIRDLLSETSMQALENAALKAAEYMTDEESVIPEEEMAIILLEVGMVVVKAAMKVSQWTAAAQAAKEAKRKVDARRQALKEVEEKTQKIGDSLVDEVLDLVDSPQVAAPKPTPPAAPPKPSGKKLPPPRMVPPAPAPSAPTVKAAAPTTQRVVEKEKVSVIANRAAPAPAPSAPAAPVAPVASAPAPSAPAPAFVSASSIPEMPTAARRIHEQVIETKFLRPLEPKHIKNHPLAMQVFENINASTEFMFKVMEALHEIDATPGFSIDKRHSHQLKEIFAGGAESVDDLTEPQIVHFRQVCGQYAKVIAEWE